MLTIESKRKKIENILKKYPEAIIADVTSNAKDGLVKLSPFYPHGGIPVPFSEGITAECVEGIWQGLKVFENEVIGKLHKAVYDKNFCKKWFGMLYKRGVLALDDYSIAVMYE